MKKISDLLNNGKNKKNSRQQPSIPTENSSAAVSTNLDENLVSLKTIFASCDDVVFKAIDLSSIRAYLIYISNLADEKIMIEIQHGLAAIINQAEPETKSTQWVTAKIHHRFNVNRMEDSKELQTVHNHILNGNSILLLDGLDYAFAFNTENEKGRSIDEPPSEQVVRGPREGFVESINTNVMLIRKKIRTPSLKIEYVTLGKQTKTKVAVVYLQGIASEGIVSEIHKRLSRIKLDGILESSYIEQSIQDAPFSPFPTMYHSERPDRACAAILEGKVAILTNGTPFVLTVPTIFIEFLYANEDYYDDSISSTAIRWIRTLSFFIALILPAIYVAVTSIHQDLLETTLLLRIASSREDLPYSVLIEVLFMQIIFEIVREAGLRMPKAIGSAVTIVGTLVIGQSAVQAGLIGPLVIIVVAVTALANFILPNYGFMQIIRLISFFMILLASIFGFLGILVGLMFMLAHLTSLRSFGVPYMSPLSPARKEAWKDVIIRAPWWAMNTRPPAQEVEDANRLDEVRPPTPPKKSN